MPCKILNLAHFVAESNRIEGIVHEPTLAEMNAHSKLLSLEEITHRELEEFVRAIQPDAYLRINPGDDVCVGGYFPPAGHISIKTRLEDILQDMTQAKVDCNHKAIYELHHRYERLHPFMDGNGRSGRALWLWCHDGYAPLGFLHQWYYDTLRWGRYE